MQVSARILVVDDEPVACRTCTRALAADGYEVTVASTREEALRKIEKERYDVALLEVKTPGAGGLRVLRAIRSTSPQTDVVVISARPTLDSAKESIRLGAFEYMPKPLAPQRLRNVVSQVLACKPWKIQERC
jgi:DNA-binding NtrC family response regulator